MMHGQIQTKNYEDLMHQAYQKLRVPNGEFWYSQSEIRVLQNAIKSIVIFFKEQKIITVYGQVSALDAVARAKKELQN